ncbi:MAG: DUF11 domain-containing protein, partial [Pirellulales bacterium]|nr:DUF11 domain-containing protein [Pirellulales bacterium]
GAEVINATTDASGHATVEIFQADPKVPSARIGIQVIRAPLPGTGEQLVLGHGTTQVTWASADITIETSGPSTATMGSSVTFQIQVNNPGSATARDVTVAARVPSGLTFAGSQPTATSTGQQTEWALGNIDPGGSRTIRVNYTVARAGTLDYCATVRTAEGLRSEHCSRIQVASAEAVLDLQLTGPNKATVGDKITFEVVVINRGSATATGLILTDRFDPGFQHLGDTKGTRQIAYSSLGDLQPGARSNPVPIEFTIVAAGRQSHEVEVKGDGGLIVRRSATVDVRQNPAGSGGVDPNTSMPAGAAIDITKESPRQARVGDRILMKIVAMNVGNVDLRQVQVEEVFPKELNPLPRQDGRKLDRQTLRWTLDSLPAGQRKVLNVEYECTAATDLNSARTITTITAGNLTRTHEAFLEILNGAAPSESGTGGRLPAAGPHPNIELTIAGPDWPIRLGDLISYPASIVNKGQGSDSQLLLEVTFPPELTPDLDRINDRLRTKNIRASQINQTLRFSPIREIRSGELINLTLFFTANRAGTATIRAQLTSDHLPEPLTVDRQTTIAP